MNRLAALLLVLAITSTAHAEQITGKQCLQEGLSQEMSVSDLVESFCSSETEDVQGLNSNNTGDFYAASCCKICRKGKACGNSCIRKSYRCKKGPGCACDAE